MRKNFPKRTVMRVFLRDGWCCRYCGHEVFFSPALKALEALSPGHGYYHVNGRRDRMSPLFFERWASVDHITPVTRGGTNGDDNLVCACWRCNLEKNDSDPESWRLKLSNARPRATGNWDGLLSVLLKLDPSNAWSKAAIQELEKMASQRIAG